MMALMETFMGRFTGDLYFIFSEIREKTPVITVKIQKRSRGNLANVIRIIYRGNNLPPFRIIQNFDTM